MQVDRDRSFNNRDSDPVWFAVDVELRADVLDPDVAGGHPEWSLRIGRNLEECLAAFELHGALAARVAHRNLGVGVEAQYRAVRQLLHRLLPADSAVGPRQSEALTVACAPHSDRDYHQDH